MQRHILRNKNRITLISGILITLGFISKWTMGNLELFEWALIIASIFGVAPIAIQAYQALKVKVVSIDVLVTIAVVGAFIIRNFEESAIVTFLFLFGAFLEQRTLNKTRSAIKELTEMAPESALKQRDDGEFEEVEVDEVDVGDVLLVKTGAKVPVDGRVISGEGSINEASITGESIPVAKEKGSKVYAGTILDNGTIQIIADRVGEDTTFVKSLNCRGSPGLKIRSRAFHRSLLEILYSSSSCALIIVWLSRATRTGYYHSRSSCPGAWLLEFPIERGRDRKWRQAWCPP